MDIREVMINMKPSGVPDNGERAPRFVPAPPSPSKSRARKFINRARKIPRISPRVSGKVSSKVSPRAGKPAAPRAYAPAEALYALEDLVYENEEFDDEAGDVARDIDRYLYNDSGYSAIASILDRAGDFVRQNTDDELRADYEKLVKQFPGLDCPSFEVFMRS